jgi:hypothetical protein
MSHDMAFAAIAGIRSILNIHKEHCVFLTAIATCGSFHRMLIFSVQQVATDESLLIFGGSAA